MESNKKVLAVPGAQAPAQSQAANVEPDYLVFQSKREGATDFRRLAFDLTFTALLLGGLVAMYWHNP